jgi:hypothetical protein
MVDGCGGGSGETGVVFEDAYVAAYCGYLLRCGLASDADWCARTQHPSLALYTASVQAGRMRYDDVVAQRCFARLASQSCTVGGFRSLEAEDSCRDLLVGVVPAGGACFSDRDCAGRAVCQGGPSNSWGPSSSCAPGVCGQPRPPRTADGPCEIDDDCLGGGVCNRLSYDPSASPRCLPRYHEDCGAPGNCTGEKTCVADPATFELRCVAHTADGESCAERLSKCAGLSSFCDGTTCRPRGRAGAACEGILSCRADLECIAGTCVQRPAPGDPCSAQGPTCSVGECVGGRCTFETCSSADAGASDASP